jgi:hypothetical protein
MKQRIALVEFSIYDQFPLVSGYLQAYASVDPTISETFEFVYYNKEVSRCEYAQTLSEIRALGASVICISSYVWNMGLVRRLLPDLVADPTIERIILGGHQISHHMERYVDRSDRKVIVINGQGEIPFRTVLQQLAGGGELAGIKGVSLFRDGELVNGGEAPMISSLDDIPSPFLHGYFDQMKHPISVFETNRGCPYKCTFCTWGGDTTTVAKFSLERVKDELLWLAKKSTMFIYLADANWGMLTRDIEISEYIGELKKQHGFPWIVYYAAAKNKPKGSVACIEKFHEGGVITSQALGIQSMSDNTLSLIERKNIKNTAFIEMFNQLKDRKIDSYCEIIWPLPGETIGTLKEGFNKLVELGAQTTIMYPALLINNARLTAQAGEFEMETLGSDDWRSELKLVKKTKFADRAAVDDGFWFYYAFFLLANTDLAKALLRYLHTATGRAYSEIIGDFAAYLRENVSTSAYAQLITTLFAEEAHGSLLTIGKLAAHLTYNQRLAAQQDVARFVVTKALPQDAARAVVAAALFSLSLPRLFAGTKDELAKLVESLDELGRPQGVTFSSLASVTAGAGSIKFQIRDRADVWREVVPFFTKQDGMEFSVVELAHPGNMLLPYNEKDPQRNFVYAHGMIQRLGFIAPVTKLAG